MTTPAACNQCLPKSILYRESTFITWKLTMKGLGPISIISSILPCTSRCVQLKALIIMLLGQIRDISTFRCSRVAIRQTFKANPLSINTLATIMSSHLTTICKVYVWSLPSRGNSSSEKETWLVANTIDTIPSKEEFVILVGPCISFNTFNRVSRWPRKITTGLK